MSIVELSFWLLVSHVVCDYALQSDAMATGKKNGLGGVPSYYWLSAHALIHGGGVALVTGHVQLGIAETFCHWGIDRLKCRGDTSIHVDQLLHVLCKAIWVYATWKAGLLCPSA